MYRGTTTVTSQINFRLIMNWALRRCQVYTQYLRLLAKLPLTSDMTILTSLILMHSKWLELVQIMGLNLPLVSRVPGRKVGRSLRVALHGPQHPIEDSLAKPSTVGIA
jgi:hypothetical protein